MEDGLVLNSHLMDVFRMVSLNPCCNGRWSRTEKVTLTDEVGMAVLILVVMEDD